ncbi:granulocyte-macrophage colony-stimulating factor receptor subunit alpha-like isoform X2 [Hypomesus transpacificus]|uniref:granulocyte-macrophage colony-stimulating factor receptor subunit alpha-like isoform X2 n=1 Tax=Hypomesus transpacificus TaxID=137520 RepID=UPI001F0799BA|nr:granulocyte-macrophage colony-stimulating factor receptor subunit alpha-like isoform X2 [Hypomesus transpacificus]
MMPSLFCALFWVLFAGATLNGGTETHQTEPNVTEGTERWNKTDTNPFEQNENQTLEHTHTLTDSPTHQITEHTHTHTTQQTDLLSREEPYPSNLCQDNIPDYYEYESPTISKPFVKECLRDPPGKDCNSASGEQKCHYLKEYSCFIYPSNKLNCSWTSHKLPDGSQYSASVIVCKKNAISTVDCVGNNVGGGTQSGAMVNCHGEVDAIRKDSADSLIFSVNVSTPNISCLYTTKFHFKNIVVLSPPANVTVQRVKGGDLLVQWATPYSQWNFGPNCFEYELSINNKEVKIRTKPSGQCHEVHHWSAWSSAIDVPADTSTQFNPLVIIGISLGIPMILLAFLILFRPQRVSKLLFPPIPQPPKKIKLLLEREDLFQIVPTPLSKYVDDITIVEEAEETPEKDPVTSW